MDIEPVEPTEMDSDGQCCAVLPSGWLTEAGFCLFDGHANG